MQNQIFKVMFFDIATPIVTQRLVLEFFKTISRILSENLDVITCKGLFETLPTKFSNKIEEFFNLHPELNNNVYDIEFSIFTDNQKAKTCLKKLEHSCTVSECWCISNDNTDNHGISPKVGFIKLCALSPQDNNNRKIVIIISVQG